MELKKDSTEKKDDQVSPTKVLGGVGYQGVLESLQQPHSGFKIPIADGSNEIKYESMSSSQNEKDFMVGALDKGLPAQGQG